MVVIFQGTYFFAMIWAKYCDYIYRFWGLNIEESFVVANQMEPFSDEPYMTIIVKVMYFSFTTMSTVGFGDMKPLNSPERIMGAIGMISSVALCSIVISMFLEIFASFRLINSCELGDLDELNQFFDCVSMKMNHGMRLPHRLEEQFIEFFNYRWNNDKVYLINKDDEHLIRKRLPDNVHDALLMTYLY